MVPSYNDFLTTILASDLKLLALWAMGERTATTDETEAAGFKAAGDRLYAAGLLERFNPAVELRSETNWYTFDGRLAPQAVPYVAYAASERIVLSRDPIPA